MKKVMSLTQILFSVTQYFFLVSQLALVILQQASERPHSKVPTSISEITIKYLHKNIMVPPLCQSGLFIQNVCLKIQLRLKM